MPCLYSQWLCLRIDSKKHASKKWLCGMMKYGRCPLTYATGALRELNRPMKAIFLCCLRHQDVKIFLTDKFQSPHISEWGIFPAEWGIFPDECSWVMLSTRYWRLYLFTYLEEQRRIRLTDLCQVLFFSIECMYPYNLENFCAHYQIILTDVLWGYKRV